MGGRQVREKGRRGEGEKGWEEGVSCPEIGLQKM